MDTPSQILKRKESLTIRDSHTYYTMTEEDQKQIKKVMSIMGKRSVAARRKDPEKMKEWAKKTAQARWKNHKKKVKK